MGRIAGTWERVPNQDTRANDAEPVPKQELRRSEPSHRRRSREPVYASHVINMRLPFARVTTREPTNGSRM